MYWYCRRTVVYLVFGLSLGCGVSVESSDDHLQHHIPAHKPPTFAAAVFEVRYRMRALLADEPGTTDSERAAARGELVDIVGWIPELAADSDLGRADWEQVRQLARELSPMVSQLESASAARPTAAVSAQYEATVDKLEAFLPAAGQQPIRSADELARVRAASLHAAMERSRE